MFAPLQTARRRIDRAKSHTYALAKLWNSRDAHDAYTHRVEMRDDGTGELFLSPTDPDWLGTFAVQFGEVLYQLRATLDSCIYDSAIVKTGKNPPPDEGKLQFPICESSKEFKGRAHYIAPLADEVKAFIESIQPYQTTPKEKAEVGRILDVLNDYSREDRHRTLPVIGALPSEISGFLNVQAGMAVERVIIDDPRLLEHESHLATFKIRSFRRGQHVSVNLKIAMEIALNRANRFEIISKGPAVMIAVVEGIVGEFQGLLGLK